MSGELLAEFSGLLVMEGKSKKENGKRELLPTSNIVISLHRSIVTSFLIARLKAVPAGRQDLAIFGVLQYRLNSGERKQNSVISSLM
ncbi:MAG: hypothetical protein U5Q03_13740 [Bacteroidota bacterium]|nr:hypothetical protein [Bacteroidota bacterium]